ncbi:eukaryotic translation initiation factor 2 (eIF-2) family protein [Zea mays]|uniref:Eukaryotic translation initiation factor 5B n=1 Tax=Zea mays TaxID=4577 RepID=A0A1D6FLJ3_MAIZE|nr:eukaryotic translation initiation factor 2 (eIF-2) family protein [Zea mays]
MGRKKNVAIDDDEYFFPQDDAADPAPPPPAPAAADKEKSKKGGKKGKKGGKAAAPDDDDYEPPPPPPPAADEDDDGEPINLVFTGKKKKKKGATPAAPFSAFSALGEEGEDQDEEDPAPSAAAEPEAINDPAEDDDDVVDFDFSKAKKKKKKDKGPRSAPAKDEDVEPAPPPPPVAEEEDEEPPVIAAAAAKKPQKKKKKKGAFMMDGENVDQILAGMEDPQLMDEPEPEEVKAQDSVAAPDADDATGKKSKKKKKKGGFTMDVDGEEFDQILAVIDDLPPPEEEPEPKDPKDEGTAATAALVDDAEGKKSKKKKKKSGRTAKEEEELDKILAELDGVPPVEEDKPTQAPQSAALAKEDVGAAEDGNVEDKAEEGGEVESAAAKKKKKKKEKEKEKKAAAKGAESKKGEEQEAPKGKVDMKKLPKHVREMQEALARRKEAEERQKREEEERLRKEEEERLRREEEERKAEEAKRRRKEREKEKLLKKKQEGKLLTGKQKEEAKRLEAMRRQFLEQSELQKAEDAAPETKKRPIYDSKKKKAQSKATETAKVVEEQQEELNEVNNDEEEYVLVDQESQSQVEESDEKTEPDQETEEPKPEEDEEDEDEWDAKSWDDIDVNLPKISAFDEEEAKPIVKKAEPVQKQENNKAQPAIPAAKKLVPSVADSKKSETDDVGASNGNVKRHKKKGPVKEDNSKSGSDLRSPICCILGHVDTGKTKLLDCIRRTNVQEGEAGGITQQIGATYFPTENIRERTRELKADATLKVPGLLVIDTPGHESFSNLRSRGSSLCDIAILVVDIMHGLEPQTIESLNLLKSRDAVFIVALNKVDRLYGWKKCPNAPIVKALKQQNEDVKREFNMRLTDIVTQFKMQGVNTALYYKNKEMEDTFNIVPTSAVSGEGIPDLLLLLVQWTQKTMEEKLTFVDEVQCTVLEVKVVEGHGTTIDVVLVNGILHEGDQIVVCGMQGPIVTTVRALLTPHPMRELRVKGTYIHHKEIRAAQGVKISAQGLEHAIAGTALYVLGPDDDLDKLNEAVMEEMTRVRSRIDRSGEGVYVQASTLGSLEALTEFLKSPAVNIPFCDFSIGPVHKKDVMKASVMLERKKEYATILAFDVKVMPDARDLAEESGVRIFVADIIYHLFDQFTAYIKNLKEEKKKESAEEAVFPCVLKIMPNCVFNKKDPIVLGVDVLEGIAKVGTPLCIPSKEFIDIGKIASVEINHKQVDMATKGQKVAIKIIANNSDEQQRSFGRHFDMEDELVSRISRRSIDILKQNYRARGFDN